MNTDSFIAPTKTKNVHEMFLRKVLRKDLIHQSLKSIDHYVYENAKITKMCVIKQEN